MLTRELPRHSQAILLHLGGGTPHESRHFARMRSDHQQTALATQFLRLALEGIQAVGVENDRSITLADQGSDELRSLGKSRNPRPHGEHALPFDERIQSLLRAR